MQNYNQQQQAVILKGIAQQVLSMNVPSFEQANKLFKEFGVNIESNFTHIVITFDLHETSFGGWNYLPLSNNYWSFCYSEKHAIELANRTCNLWAKGSLNPKSYPVETKNKPIKIAMSDSFIIGFDKNGRRFEAHKKPTWL